MTIFSIFIKFKSYCFLILVSASKKRINKENTLIMIIKILSTLSDLKITRVFYKNICMLAKQNKIVLHS